MAEPVDLPLRLWRVVWEEGYGWPECTRRERTQRTFRSPQSARRQVATIARFPDHHQLIGVYTTRCYWERVDAEHLPEPIRSDEGAS
jgi:hypothetical protein